MGSWAILARMDEKMAFSNRLNELCDDMGIPPKGENRQQTLGKLFTVSQNGARKWLEGEGFPSTERMIAVAKWGKVSFEWLATGRGTKHLPTTATRPEIVRLLHAAEDIPSYKVDQTIKIMAAIAVEGDHPNSTKRKAS